MVYIGLSDFTSDSEKYRQQFVSTKIKKLYQQFQNTGDTSPLLKKSNNNNSVVNRKMGSSKMKSSSSLVEITPDGSSQI